VSVISNATIAYVQLIEPSSTGPRSCRAFKLVERLQAPPSTRGPRIR